MSIDPVLNRKYSRVRFTFRSSEGREATSYWDLAKIFCIFLRKIFAAITYWAFLKNLRNRSFPFSATRHYPTRLHVSGRDERIVSRSKELELMQPRLRVRSDRREHD